MTQAAMTRSATPSVSALLSKIVELQRPFITEELAEELKSAKRAMKDSPEDYTERGEEDPSMDVRLQFYPNGSWAVRTGLSDFDQDHRGFWGASSMGLDTSAEALAQELVDQVLEAVAAMHGDSHGDEESAGATRGMTPFERLEQLRFDIFLDQSDRAVARKLFTKFVGDMEEAGSDRGALEEAIVSFRKDWRGAKDWDTLERDTAAAMYESVCRYHGAEDLGEKHWD